MKAQNCARCQTTGLHSRKKAPIAAPLLIPPSLGGISIEWLFVLSGFLIGTMMIRSFDGDRKWLQCAKDFWLRRWFRTIPNYYLFVLVNLLLTIYGISDGVFEYRYLAFSQNLAWVEKHRHFSERLGRLPWMSGFIC